MFPTFKRSSHPASLFFSLALIRIKAYNKSKGGEVVKRKDLLKLFVQNGWYFKRNGARHDVYTNGTDSEYIPRHVEIAEVLAWALIKKWHLQKR
jgi:mRNA interferase HicA